MPSYLETSTSGSETVTIHFTKKKTTTKTTVTTNRKNYTQATSAKVTVIPQFKTTPMKKTVKSGQSTVKPRLMLVFDNSGSMTAGISGVFSKSRWKALNDVIKKVATTYNDKVLWNVSTFFYTQNGYRYTMPAPKYANYTTGQQVINYLNSEIASGGTPSIPPYLIAADFVYKNIEYACQKNFIIYLSDGDANSDVFTRNATADMQYVNSSGYSYPYDTQYYASRSPLKPYYDLVGDNLPRDYLWFFPTYSKITNQHTLSDGWQYYYHGDTSANNCGYPNKLGWWNSGYLNNENVGYWCQPSATPKTQTMYTLDANGNKVEFTAPSYYSGYSHNNINTNNMIYNGIEYFSDKIYRKDLIPDNVGTSIHGKTDKEGNPWSDKQNIQTMTIAYGNGMSHFGEAFLTLAARVDEGIKNKDPNKRKTKKDGYALYPETGYYYVNSEEELQSAFDEMLKNIAETTVTASSSSSNVDAGQATITGGDIVETTSDDDTPAEPEILPSSTTDSTDSEEGEAIPSSAITFDQLYTTSVAAPSNVSSTSTDVSDYPGNVIVNPKVKDDGTIEWEEKDENLTAGSYGTMSTLNLSVYNWSSTLQFHRIFKVQMPLYKLDLILDKYSCNVLDTHANAAYTQNQQNKTIVTALCNGLDEKALNPAFPARKILLQKPGDDTAFTVATEKTVPENLHESFGFVDVNKAEFEAGFWPWLLRSPNKTDVQIEADVAALGLDDNRQVAEYRDRLKPKYKAQKDEKGNEAKDENGKIIYTTEVEHQPAAIEREMGDVIDSSPLSIAAYEPLNSNEDVDRAQYILMGSNDGMLYTYKRSNTTNAPYSLAFNYLPYKMPREYLTSTTDPTFTPHTETLGEILPASTAGSDYGNFTNQHIYGINGQLSYIRTPTYNREQEENEFDSKGNPVTKKIKSAVRERESIVVGTMGQGGRGVFSMIANGRSPMNKTAVGFDANLSTLKYANPWESRNGELEKNDVPNKLGYTINTARLGKTQIDWATEDENRNPFVMPRAYAKTGQIRMNAFVANGYPTGGKTSGMRHNQEDAPTLYIYDAAGLNFRLGEDNAQKAQTNAGDLIKAISVPNFKQNDFSINTLGSPAVVDIDFDGIIDVAYAGDYSGDLYRFDFRSDVSQWSATKIFTGSVDRPITASPAVYRIPKERGEQYMVLFGTGSDVYKEDRQTTVPTQRLYGIRDDLTVLKPETITDADLMARKFDDEYKIKTTVDPDTGEEKTDIERYISEEYEKTVTSETKRTCMSTASNCSYQTTWSGRGWYLDLLPGEEHQRSSERVIAEPIVLLGAVFFTTRIYNLQGLADATKGDGVISCSSFGEDIGTKEKTDADGKTSIVCNYENAKLEQEGDWVSGDTETGDWIKSDEESTGGDAGAGSTTTASGTDCPEGYTCSPWIPSDEEIQAIIKDWELKNKDGQMEDIWQSDGPATSTGGDSSKESCAGGGGSIQTFSLKAEYAEQLKQKRTATKTEGATETKTWKETQTITTTETKTDIYGWDQTTVYPTSGTMSTLGEGWLIGLDIMTGGAMTAEYTGVQFTRSYATGDESTLAPVDKLVGVHYDTITSAAILQSMKEALHADEAINANGQMGNGYDMDSEDDGDFFKQNEKNNTCLSSQDYNFYLAKAGIDPSNKAAAKTVLDNQGVKVRLCSGTFIRTSLREIKSITK